MHPPRSAELIEPPCALAATLRPWIRRLAIVIALACSLSPTGRASPPAQSGPAQPGFPAKVPAAVSNPDIQVTSSSIRWGGSNPQIHSEPSAPAPARIIVKLRGAAPREVFASPAPGAAGADASRLAAEDPTLASLMARHGARSASPLAVEHIRAQQRQRHLSSGVADASRRFSLRAARAPAGAVAPDFSRTFVLDLGSRSPSAAAAALRSLRADPEVVYAEEDRIVRTCYLPNDPYYASTGSWGQSYADLHGLKTIGTTAAWDSSQGAGVVVAVIDTGVDYEHPDIADSIWLNAGEIPGNAIDDDANGFVDDLIGWDFAGTHYWEATEDADPRDGHGHGSHVAGTIAATGDNGLGVIGVAWKAEVMVVKGLDDSGSGSDSQLARCILYAVDNGADVINASWGSEGSSQTLRDAVNYAHAHGVVFVAAAGNSASDAAKFAPASIPAAIAVAALDPEGGAAFFSNFGSRIDVSAPGQDILSLESGTAGYTQKDGTSMAAPHVSGVAALILSRYPSLSVEQVRQVLRVSAVDLGTAGKDPAYGSGRVNAAAALELGEHVLEARILGPAESTAIWGPVEVSGTVGGPGFSGYVLEFGAGAAPQSWTMLRASAASVARGELGVFDPSTLTDGLYTVRLRAQDASGATFSDQIEIVVRYLEITSPLPPTVLPLTSPMKPGCAYTISGSARGPSFQNYTLEWAPGTAATSGWSAEGFALTGGGLVPVDGGSLAEWTPPAGLEGYCTIRLTVNNSGFASTTTTSVYAEPALVSSGWPALLVEVPDNQGPALVRQPDGSTRFVFASRFNPVELYSLAYDGSRETRPHSFGGRFPAPVADLDDTPGDEVVVVKGYCVEILSSGLEPIRTILAPAGRDFGYDQMSLADLDNDGSAEILVASRDGSAGFSAPGAVHVYRADGTPFPGESIAFPVESPFAYAQIVAADLDGNGRKEIVVAVGPIDQPHYTVEAFNSDGSPCSGWTPVQVTDAKLGALATGDLDHDGTTEIVISESSADTNVDRIIVRNGSGAVREGWPVPSAESQYLRSEFSIGDLDDNGQMEIVWINGTMISVLRGDGSAWCEPWSVGGEAPFNMFGTPILADIDGDGHQEIVTVPTFYSFEGSRPYRHAALAVYSATGTLRRTWPLFGTAGQQPAWGTAAVGDFNADGATDIAVTLSLMRGGGDGGWLFDSAMTCLTTGTPFNAAGSDWINDHHDPQNSRAATVAPAFIAGLQDRTVSAGTAVTLSAEATGSPLPRFQWQKNGVDIAGANRATLTFPSVQAWDAGHYTVTVSSAAGSATTRATLTVSRDTASDARALNLSTRALVQAADKPLIPGFVIEGTGTKRLLIRAVGPRLRDLGVDDPVDDPRLFLKRYDPAVRAYVDIVENDNWPDDEALRLATATVGAFPLLPASRDAALLLEAGPGQYTVITDTASGPAQGVALVEVYDADTESGPARLTNVSNRGYVGAGGHVMIAGFVISRDGPKTLLLRAVGPGLATLGVPDPLPDPQLALYRSTEGTGQSEVILTNDDWSNHPDAATTASTAQMVGAFPLDDDSKDAALVATLRPGIYTIHASGVGGATGEALVELYVIP